MKRFYILTFVDLVNVGYNVSNVMMFDDIEKANKKMLEMYLDKCKEENIDDPMEEDNYGHQFGKNYFAYISGCYYWDIFNRDIEY